MIQPIRVGITHGDINGIGYEVILKALSDVRLIEDKTVILYGSAKAAAFHKKQLNLGNVNFFQIQDAAQAPARKLCVLNCADNNVRVDLGKPTDIAGRSAFEALECAVADLQDGKIDVLVTAPINKSTIYSQDFLFPGHTEYLTQRCNNRDSLMLMISPTMRIGVVTGHVPLSRVPQQITQQAILSKLDILHDTLIRDFSITRPRIAVLGLNPHAGDSGLLGSEEIEVIQPALAKAQAAGMHVFGPYPADGFFGSGDFAKFDAILAMYHDQGLAPFKSISFDEGVNYTAGLPIIRTSPAHGTGYDIAGQGVASEASFRNAIYLATDVFRGRQLHAEITANPLQKLTHTYEEE